MIDDDISAAIMPETDGSFAAVYGPFSLRSAFQPIFRRRHDATLHLEAFEGLIRITRGHDDVAPALFFAAVDTDDRARIDALCRRLHILNLTLVRRRSASLFLNFNPSLFADPLVTAREAAQIADLTNRVGMPARQIVCEITEKKASNRAALVAATEDLRAHGFRIAVDDYGAEDSDIDRIELLTPDIVKFDGEWVRRYMENQPGRDLLRDIVARFRSKGITTLFEGLEHHWQVELCAVLRIDLLQGYALARPEPPPTRFNELFPEPAERNPLFAPAPQAGEHFADNPAPPDTHMPIPRQPDVLPVALQRKPFGRRGR